LRLWKKPQVIKLFIYDYGQAIGVAVITSELSIDILAQDESGDVSTMPYDEAVT
jgi:hypothetical protein